LGDQETPLGSSTSVKDPRDKTTQRRKPPMRCMAFRVRGMESKESGEVSWPWKRDALVQGETHAYIEESFHPFTRCFHLKREILSIVFQEIKHQLIRKA
jgi:hypothetical protein